MPYLVRSQSHRVLEVEKESLRPLLLEMSRDMHEFRFSKIPIARTKNEKILLRVLSLEISRRTHKFKFNNPNHESL